MVVKVTVPHFLTADAASLYMLGSGDVQLYEVKAFEGDFHSWFVGQTVQRGWCHYSLLRYSAEVVHKLTAPLQRNVFVMALQATQPRI